jgi:chemotaxis protein MotB
MRTRRGRRGGRRRYAAEGHSDTDRWLLTYADMITLLMALFMVLFSITSVNKSKLEVLSKSLQEAFSGKVLPGGTSIRDSGANPKSTHPPADAPIPAITSLVGPAGATAADAAREQDNFRRLKEQIDAYAREHGLQSQMQTVIAQRGLVIRLLTDRVLFDSGAAELKQRAFPLLAQVGLILRTKTTQPVMVEGHTDTVPIHGSLFPTNWELSTARASRVVRALIHGGVPPSRLSAAGYAALHPISTNVTASGRSRNRRVEVVVLRSGQGASSRGGGQR